MKKKDTIRRMQNELRQFICEHIEKLGTNNKWDQIINCAYDMESALVWVMGQKCDWTPLSILNEKIEKEI